MLYFIAPASHKDCSCGTPSPGPPNGLQAREVLGLTVVRMCPYVYRTGMPSPIDIEHVIG